MPDVRGLRFQVVHSTDVAEAFRLGITEPVRGAFNLAAEPVVDAQLLGQLFEARTVRLPRPMVRAALAAAWRARLTPAPPQLFDAFVRLPLMDCARAAEVLGWRPRVSAQDAVLELVEALRTGTGAQTPPLAPRLPGGRLRELATGVGRRA